MKKTYEKPQIYMERFELAEHIASGCGQTVDWRESAGCFDIIGGLFNPEMSCSVSANPDQGEDYCYYAAGSGLFTS